MTAPANCLEKAPRQQHREGQPFRVQQSLGLEETEPGVCKGQAGGVCRVGTTEEGAAEREVLKATKGQVSCSVLISTYI